MARSKKIDATPSIIEEEISEVKIEIPESVIDTKVEKKTVKKVIETICGPKVVEVEI